MDVTENVKRYLAGLAHDFLAHPLIGLSGGAAWAWRLHDHVGEVATVGVAGTTLRLDGPARMVQAAMADLERCGWENPGAHFHGTDGRGCGEMLKPTDKPDKGWEFTPCLCGTPRKTRYPEGWEKIRFYENSDYGRSIGVHVLCPECIERAIAGIEQVGADEDEEE